VGDGEVALVVGAVGLGLGEALGNGKVLDIVLLGLFALAEGAVEVAQCLLH
jgi:hypothetical protein